MWYLKTENERGDWRDERHFRFDLIGGETVYCPMGRNAQCGAIEAADLGTAAETFGLTYDPLPPLQGCSVASPLTETPEAEG